MRPSMIPKYWSIFCAVTPWVDPNISSIAERSQLILLNNEPMPVNQKGKHMLMIWHPMPPEGGNVQRCWDFCKI